MDFYTYAYLREDRTPYYIGEGTYHADGQDRYNSPNRRINLPPKERRIILKNFQSEEDAFRHEIYMIHVFGRKDIGTGILRNMTDGGEGARGRVLTKEHKNNISKSNKGKKRTEEFRERCKETAKRTRNRRKKCIYRGIEFDSQTLAAQYFGISNAKVSLDLK